MNDEAAADALKVTPDGAAIAELHTSYAPDSSQRVDHPEPPAAQSSNQQLSGHQQGHLADAQASKCTAEVTVVDLRQEPSCTSAHEQESDAAKIFAECGVGDTTNKMQAPDMEAAAVEEQVCNVVCDDGGSDSGDAFGDFAGVGGQGMAGDAVARGGVGEGCTDDADDDFGDFEDGEGTQDAAGGDSVAEAHADAGVSLVGDRYGPVDTAGGGGAMQQFLSDLARTLPEAALKGMTAQDAGGGDGSMLEEDAADVLARMAGAAPPSAAAAAAASRDAVLRLLGLDAAAAAAEAAAAAAAEAAEPPPPPVAATTAERGGNGGLPAAQSGPASLDASPREAAVLARAVSMGDPFGASAAVEQHAGAGPFHPLDACCCTVTASVNEHLHSCMPPPQPVTEVRCRAAPAVSGPVVLSPTSHDVLSPPSQFTGHPIGPVLRYARRGTAVPAAVARAGGRAAALALRASVLCRLSRVCTRSFRARGSNPLSCTSSHAVLCFAVCAAI